MKQVTKLEIKKMVVEGFKSHFNQIKCLYKETYTFDSFVKLINEDDDFSDMLRKYNIFIGYVLGYMSADIFYDTKDKIKKLLLESNNVNLLIYAFGDDKDAIFALKGKGIEVIE